MKILKAILCFFGIHKLRYSQMEDFEFSVTYDTPTMLFRQCERCGQEWRKKSIFDDRDY